MAASAPSAAKGRPLDEAAQTFAVKLHRVPEPVRRACLGAYVERCRQIHQLAFLQWRKMYPSSLRYDEDQVDCILKAALARTQSAVHPKQQVKEIYFDMMALPYPEFEKRYKMRDLRNKDFLINRFS